MSERKPLTLEELRQMDGEPVLFVSLKDGRKKWRVVQSLEKLVEVVKVICFTDDGGETVESYGKTWLAYAYEPPRLDRSAWEPCILCAVGDWKHLEYSFCPHCGRPLTDAAWDMFEKRLEGNK